jgi:hypothetical protein
MLALADIVLPGSVLGHVIPSRERYEIDVGADGLACPPKTILRRDWSGIAAGRDRVGPTLRSPFIRSLKGRPRAGRVWMMR